MTRQGKKQKRNIKGGKYHWELQNWANKVFLEYDNKCIICNTKHNLEPHHILQVKPYDELYTSISNGCIICKSCHYEYHEEYGSNITPVTLVEFAKKHYKSNNNDNVKSLNNTIKQVKLMNKYYRRELDRLKDLLNENDIDY